MASSNTTKLSKTFHEHFGFYFGLCGNDNQNYKYNKIILNSPNEKFFFNFFKVTFTLRILHSSVPFNLITVNVDDIDRLYKEKIVKYLGVTLDNTLFWNMHKKEVVDKQQKP